jgi:hypothetical protein
MGCLFWLGGINQGIGGNPDKFGGITRKVRGIPPEKESNTT